MNPPLQTSPWSVKQGKHDTTPKPFLVTWNHFIRPHHCQSHDVHMEMCVWYDSGGACGGGFMSVGMEDCWTAGHT